MFNTYHSNIKISDAQILDTLEVSQQLFEYLFQLKYVNGHFQKADNALEQESKFRYFMKYLDYLEIYDWQIIKGHLTQRQYIRTSQENKSFFDARKAREMASKQASKVKITW